MSFDYYLLVDGIQGDSTADRYPGAFTLFSYTWGVTNHTNTFAAGGGSGKPIFQELTVTKPLSKGSPALWLDAANSHHIPHVTLVGVEPSSNLEFERITLSDVVVTSYQESGHMGSLPLIVVTFSYSKVEYEVQTLDNSGKPVSEEAGWDVRGGKQI